MTFKEFLKTKTFRNNALAFFGIVIFIFLFNSIALNLYTDHGNSVTIPDLSGMTEPESESVLANLDLIGEIRDSVFSVNDVPGTIVDQFPKAGMKVKKNRKVIITLCAVSREMVIMPQLTDISHRQAINLLENAGLVAGKIEYKPSEFQNLVLEQKINGINISVGDKVPKGSIVDLVLGTDSDGTTSEVPTLFGRNLFEARLTLSESFLNVGTVYYDETFITEDQKIYGLIYKQSPDPEEVFEVMIGTSIDIWLTLDPEKLKAITDTEETDNSFF